MSVFVFPGQKVADWQDGGQVLGQGLYVQDGTIIASLAGELTTTSTTSSTTTTTTPTTTAIMQVIPHTAIRSRPYTQTIPAVGQTVLGQVTRLNSKYAGVDILAVEGSGQRFMEPVKGTVRLQDIVSVEEREIPPIQHAFRPGDVVRARVIGIGDPSAGLLLSTGVEDRLGVVYARSAAAAAPLLPAAWNEMVCSQTGLREKRKCAKPE